jgi:hypothetical protein
VRQVSGKSEELGAAFQEGGSRSIWDSTLLGLVLVLVTLTLIWLKLDLDRTQNEIKGLMHEQAKLRAELLEKDIKNIHLTAMILRLDDREAQVIEAICHSDRNARYDANRSGCTLSYGLYLKYTPLATKRP